MMIDTKVYEDVWGRRNVLLAKTMVCMEIHEFIINGATKCALERNFTKSQAYSEMDKVLQVELQNIRKELEELQVQLKAATGS